MNYKALKKVPMNKRSSISDLIQAGQKAIASGARPEGIKNVTGGVSIADILLNHKQYNKREIQNWTKALHSQALLLEKTRKGI